MRRSLGLGSRTSNVEFLSVQIMFDKTTGRSRGFAFVEYSPDDKVWKAVELFHKKDLQGARIVCADI